MTAWKVTFEVDVPEEEDARDDSEAVQAAIAFVQEGDWDVLTVEPTPSRFGPASRSQDKRRP